MKNSATGLSVHGCEESGNGIAAVVSLGPLAWGAGWGGRGAGGGCTWLELVLDVQEASNELRVHQWEWQVLVVTHCKEKQHEQTDSVADLFCILHLSCHDRLDCKKAGFLSAFLNQTQEATILITSQHEPRVIPPSIQPGEQ